MSSTTDNLFKKKSLKQQLRVHKSWQKIQQFEFDLNDQKPPDKDKIEKNFMREKVGSNSGQSPRNKLSLEG